MDLSVLGTVEIQGERVRVRAAPLSLLSEIATDKSAGGFVRFDLVGKVLARCCSQESDGAPVDPDSLALSSALRLFRIAIGDETPEGSSEPDFRSPPESSGSGG